MEQSKNDKKENIQTDQSAIFTEERQKRIRCLNVLLFWLAMICILFFAVNTVVYLFSTDAPTIFGIALFTSIFSSIVFVVESCFLAQSKKQMLLIYLLMDNALLILILALVAWNGLTAITFQVLQPIEYVILTLNSISMFLFVGNFRLQILHYPWGKCEIILTKIVLIICSSVYIGIGCYFMVTQLSELNVFSSTYAARVKDFSIFYVFGLFSLFLEVYGKISNIDGTGDHKYHYSTEKERKDE